MLTGRDIRVESNMYCDVDTCDWLSTMKASKSILRYKSIRHS